MALCTSAHKRGRVKAAGASQPPLAIAVKGQIHTAAGSQKTAVDAKMDSLAKCIAVHLHAVLVGVEQALNNQHTNSARWCAVLIVGQGPLPPGCNVMSFLQLILPGCRVG